MWILQDLTKPFAKINKAFETFIFGLLICENDIVFILVAFPFYILQIGNFGMRVARALSLYIVL